MELLKGLEMLRSFLLLMGHALFWRNGCPESCEWSASLELDMKIAGRDRSYYSWLLMLFGTCRRDLRWEAYVEGTFPVLFQSHRGVDIQPIGIRLWTHFIYRKATVPPPLSLSSAAQS
ncbi:hypothetical protein F4861DRAFT_469481 [Xylaria intraflava]|nr:hypothetical protein F4861DRAFT_469481 [Xylaria intraflava]